MYEVLHIRMCRGTYTEAKEDANCFVLSCSFWSLETWSLTEPGGRQWPASPRVSFLSSLNSDGITDTHVVLPSFLCGDADLTSDTCVYMSSSLPLSPSPYPGVLKMLFHELRRVPRWCGHSQLLSSDLFCPS